MANYLSGKAVSYAQQVAQAQMMALQGVGNGKMPGGNPVVQQAVRADQGLSGADQPNINIVNNINFTVAPGGQGSGSPDGGGNAFVIPGWQNPFLAEKQAAQAAARAGASPNSWYYPPQSPQMMKDQLLQRMGEAVGNVRQILPGAKSQTGSQQQFQQPNKFALGQTGSQAKQATS